MGKTEKEYLGYTHQQWQTLILFALLVAVMILAYNIGHYTSLEYQKMIEPCVCNQVNLSETLLNNPFK